MAALSVFLLGQFRVRRDGEPLALGRKVPWRVLQLLQAIAVLGPRESSAARVVAALWPDAEGDAGARAFEIALHRLRRLLGDAHAVTFTRGQVGLDAERVWIDFESFEALADDVERRGDAASLAQAMALYQGALLASEDEHAWLLPVRERLRSRFLRLAAQGVALLRDADRDDAAIDLLRRALEREPIAEELHRRLIATLASAGRDAEALDAYRQCERLLLRVVGVRPSADTRRACPGVPPGA